jgi:hypothetical protein
MVDTLGQKEEPDPLPGLTWHTGSLLPYASLWSVIRRVVFLNALTANEIHLLGARQSGYLGMNSLIANYKVIDIPALAKNIGESVSAFQYSTLELLSPWTHQLFQVNTLRFCPECIARGFHSIFHCLVSISRCPIHNHLLVSHCRCARAISACLQPQLFSNPSLCECERCSFFTKHVARRPTIDPLATHAFDDLAKWIQLSSQRVHMMCVAEPWTTATGEGDLTKLLPIWSSLAGADIPKGVSEIELSAHSVVSHAN